MRRDAAGPPYPRHGACDSIRGSPVMLATIRLDGKVRLLNGAWEALLGRDLKEAPVKSFHELIPFERAGAEALLGTLLDPNYLGPVEFSIRCASGTERRFLWHRRFDPQEERMYIAGEEIGANAGGDGRRVESEPTGSRARP